MRTLQKNVQAQIEEYYVYMLFNVQTKEIFYIGKGKGQRFLDHLKEARKDGNKISESKKIQTIQQIGENNIGCTILRRHLSEQEAFHVEAATIDLLRSSYKTIKTDIVNIQSGHGYLTNGIMDIKQFKTMNKYIELYKSETVLCLNIKTTEQLNQTLPQLIHNKKWKVKEEEAKKATYTVVECDNVVIAIFKSDCWKSNADGKTCTFNGNQINSPNTLLDRFVSHKLPKRKQGTPQARYINYTDIKLAKK